MESPLGAPPPTSSNFSHNAIQEQRRTRQRRGETMQHQQQPNGDHRQNGDEWVEPPLRAPVPSFQDYPGLTRQGVLETMMPLGTRPSARVRARAKGDPLRRIVQAKNLGGGLIPVDDGSATPEPLPISEAPRVGTLRTDAASRRESPATDLNADSDIHSSPSRQSLRNPKLANAKITLKGQASTPSPIKETSPHETPPSASRYPGDFVHAPVPSGSPFFTAAAMANKNGSPEVQRPLAFLYSATEQDPELETLLKSATKESILNKDSEVSQKIKQVKKMYRAQNNAPHSRGSSIAANLMGAFGQNSARANDTRHAFSPSLAPETTIGLASQQSSPHQKPATNSSELLPSQPVKQSLKIRLNNPSNNFSSPRTGSPSKKSFGASQNSVPPITRRSSSSSLSSVDSELANQSSPNMPKRKGRRNLTGSKKTRRGNNDIGEPEGLTGPELNGSARLGVVDAMPEEALQLDPQVEAERQRLDASVVNDAIPMESNIRSRANLTRESAPAPTSSSRPMRETRSNLRSAIVLDEDNDDLVELTGSRKRPATPTALGRPPKKPRTKISPIKTQKRPGAANMARPENSLPSDGAVGNKDDLSESSENNDTCSACGNPGYLVICDGCDHSWHFDCAQPPVRESEISGGKWYCSNCTRQQEVFKHQERELFMGLKQSSEWYTPKAFNLPKEVRTRFKNVRTGADGEYEPDPDLRSMPRNMNNQTHEARYRVEKDAKGNWIHCHYCGKTSNGTRDMVQCDYCPLWWHMDCLDPPRANPPYHGNNLPDNKRVAWKCPAHADHDMKRTHPKNGHGEVVPMNKRIREPKSTVTLSTSLSRGVPNNGNIEVESESDEDSFQEEEAADGVKYKLPREGIMLDFISKIKSDRLKEEQAARERTVALAEKEAKVKLANAVRLSEILAAKRVKERLAAFNLTRFKLDNPEMRLADNDVENLIAELENQAPEEMVRELDSSGTSTQRGGSESNLTEPQRGMLEKMQKHIQKMLDTGSGST